MSEASNYVHDKSAAEGELLLSPEIMKEMLLKLNNYYIEQEK